MKSLFVSAITMFSSLALAQMPPMFPMQNQNTPMQYNMNNGIAAPMQRQMGEQSVYTTQNNGCSALRYDNTRMQNGQLIPRPAGQGTHN